MRQVVDLDLQILGFQSRGATIAVWVDSCILARSVKVV